MRAGVFQEKNALGNSTKKKIKLSLTIKTVIGWISEINELAMVINILSRKSSAVAIQNVWELRMSSSLTCFYHPTQQVLLFTLKMNLLQPNSRINRQFYFLKCYKNNWAQQIITKNSNLRLDDAYNTPKKSMQWKHGLDLPDDIINTNNTLWFLFIVNKCCLADDPGIATIASQETITWCFGLTFVYYCNPWNFDRERKKNRRTRKKIFH